MSSNRVNQKQQMRFVVFGLFEIEPETLMTAFNDENIYPTKIVKMAMKRRVNDELQNYILFFDCENVERDQEDYLKVLQKVKSVYSIRVNWAIYENRQNGPPQCFRCLQFGHEDISCRNNSVCFRCSEQHDSRSCAYFLPNSRMIPRDKLKCLFCQGGHTALWTECEVRKKLINEWNLASEAEKNGQQEAVAGSSKDQNVSESNKDQNTSDMDEDDAEDCENQTKKTNVNYQVNMSSELKDMINLKRNLRRRWQRTHDRQYKVELNRLQKEIKEELLKQREKL